MEPLRNFLNQISLPVLVSAITSLVVSLGSFLIGNRFAKERSDRGAVRDVYRELRQHVLEAREAIDRGKPRRWEDFPTKHNRTVPPVAEMERSGRLALISNTLAKRLVEIEREALAVEWHYRSWLKEVLIPEITTLFNERVRNPNSSISMRSYSNPNIMDLAMHGVGDIDEEVARLSTKSLGWGLEVSLERSKSHILHAYEDTMVEGTLADLIRAVVALVDKDTAGSEHRSKLLAISSELERLESILTGRVREPQPFWETVRRAFTDIGAR